MYSRLILQKKEHKKLTENWFTREETNVFTK